MCLCWLQILILALQQIRVLLLENIELLVGLVGVDLAIRYLFQVESQVVVLLENYAAFIVNDIHGQVKIPEHSHAEILHDVLPSVSLLIGKRAASHLIAKVLLASLLQLIVLLRSVHTADDTRILVELGFVEVFLLIVALKRIVCQMREEK